MRITRALRSLSDEALSKAAFTKRPFEYATFLITPSTGARCECTLKTFMKMESLSDFAPPRYGSGTSPTTLTRPSAGQRPRPLPSGFTCCGSRKNCTTKTFAIQSGSDDHPEKVATTTAPTSRTITKGTPSRARMGWGYRCFMRLLVAARVHQLVLLDPRHHGAQLLAHLLDVVLGQQAALGVQRGRTGAVLEDEVARVLARLDALQAVPHRLPRLRADHLRAGLVLAEFRVVGDRVVHVGDAALVDQVHDEFRLVQALEVGHLGSVAGLGQRLVARLDQ